MDFYKKNDVAHSVVHLVISFNVKINICLFNYVYPNIPAQTLCSSTYVQYYISTATHRTAHSQPSSLGGG